MVVDHKNKRLMELVEGKSRAELTAALEDIPGRENVRWGTLDIGVGHVDGGNVAQPELLHEPILERQIGPLSSIAGGPQGSTAGDGSPL